MKKPYQRPEFHAAAISTGKSMDELADLPDDELLEELKTAGYFENKIYYQASENFLARSIAGETVLIPVGEQCKRLNGFATFTDTGQFLWNLLSQKRCTESDLILALSREYHCPQKDVQADVNAYLEKMVRNGFVVSCG